MFFSAKELNLPLVRSANTINPVQIGLHTGDANYLPEWSKQELQFLMPYSVMTLTSGNRKDNPKTYHIVSGREPKNQNFYYSYGISGHYFQLKNIPHTARKNHISVHRKLSAALRANVQIYNKKKAAYSLKAAWFFDEEIQDWVQYYVSLDPSQIPTATLF